MRRGVGFVAGFAAARAILFLAPIVLANLLPIDLYGRVEFAQSTAMLGALLVGLGLPASVPLVLLRDEVAARWESLLALAAGMATLLLVIAAASAFRYSGLAWPVFLPLATAILLLQGLWSTTLKSQGHSTGAMFLDAGFWVSALAGGVIVAFLGGNAASLAGALSVYAAALLGWTLFALRANKTPITANDVRENIRVSLPLMMIGILAVLVNSSNRIILNWAASPEILGYFAIMFRATAIPIVGHQILIIGQFRNLFSWDERTLGRRATAIPAGVTLLAFVFWVFIDQFGYLLGPRFAETFAQFRLPTLLVLALTVLWSAIGLNDLLVSRLLIAGKVARFAAAYLAVALPALTLFTIHASRTGDAGVVLYDFVVAQSCMMLGYFLIQAAVIWRNGHRFTFLWGTALLGYAFLILTFVVGERL